MVDQTMKLEIVAPDCIFYTGEAVMVELNTTEGEIGVYPGHIPMTMIAAPGTLTITEEELREAFHQIASVADILVGNEEDFQLCLGFTGPEAGGKDLTSKIENFKNMIYQVKAKYKNAKMYATTLRQVISANEHLWGGILLAEDTWCVEEPRPIPVMDRIGGGDGFSGGLLYGVTQGWEAEKCLQFGWASGVLAASSLNDYAEPADEKQVWDIYAGNARVQR